jgi:hypothetical protein
MIWKGQQSVILAGMSGNSRQKRRFSRHVSKTGMNIMMLGALD